MPRGARPGTIILALTRACPGVREPTAPAPDAAFADYAIYIALLDTLFAASGAAAWPVHGTSW